MTIKQYDQAWKQNRVYRIATRVVFGVLMAGVAVLVFGYAVMWLWNGIMTSVVHAREITFWQSVGLLVLARILVGGLGHGKHECRRSKHSGGDAWREYDEWWKAVGQHSFREFSNTQQARKEP